MEYIQEVGVVGSSDSTHYDHVTRASHPGDGAHASADAQRLGFVAALTSGGVPDRSAPVSPRTKHKRAGTKRRLALQRKLMEEDRRRFLKWYNPAVYDTAVARLNQRRDMKSWYAARVGGLLGEFRCCVTLLLTT